MDNQNRIWAQVKLRDKLARWFIVLGGLAIIGSMLTMILFIGWVTLPLFSGSKKELLNNFQSPLPAEDIRFFEIGPYHENISILDKNGFFTIHAIQRQLEPLSRFQINPDSVISLPSVADSQTESNRPTIAADESPELTPQANAQERDKEKQAIPTVLHAVKSSATRVDVYWSDGSVSLYNLHYQPLFDENGKRRLQASLEFLSRVLTPKDLPPSAPGLLRSNSNGKTILMKQREDGQFWMAVQTRVEDFMGDITTDSKEFIWNPGIAEKITTFTVPKSANMIYCGTDQGNLYVWSLENAAAPTLIAHAKAFETAKAITSLCMMLGDVSLAVGDEEGRIAIWDLLNGQPPRMERLHLMPFHNAAILKLFTSFRNKSLISLDEKGNIQLSYMTSERLLLEFPSTVPVLDIAYAERGDNIAVLDTQNMFWLYSINSPHPEISWKTLWGKVWYEGYQEPAHVWQSSAGTDDFEPKLSLAPLVFGSLKGTLYGLLFSLPLALFGAMYVSHLMDPRYRVFVKPIIELMAAIPSVVVGFLAALWLASRLEKNLFAVLFSLGTIPLLIAVGMNLLSRRKAKVNGKEFIWAFPVVLIAFFAAYELGVFVQYQFFDNHINLWLYQHLKMQVDQRNCVVISFALGFAVIPVIFTIAEDALYNVPKHLTAAALALGSSRWQTLRHVVLPMASPGIFAAVMIGFGRAVGETMIVLMATGNTPIMSSSIFNGMRTLSANIAVEIPEAPVDSTLYRILFLSAALLFMLTFCINTVAELVRNHLRKKYKNL